MVGGLDPGLEQAVHLRQVRDGGPVADLDQELIPHCPEETLDLPSSLWFPGPGVDELYAEDGAAAQQPRIDERAAVVQVDGLRDAAPLQGGAERRRHPDHVVVIGPPGAHHGAGVVVEEREKVGLAPGDDRAVEGVAGPHLVRPGALEPAEGPLLLLLPRRDVQLQPLEQPLQGPVRRRPARRQLQDPPDLGGGPPRLLPLQRLRQRQHLRRGPRRRLPRRTAPARRTRRPHKPAATGPASPATPAPAARPARHGHGRPAPWPAGPAPPRSCPPRRAPAPASTGTGPSPGPAPASPSCPPRPESSRSVPSLAPAIAGPTDSDSKQPPPGRGELALNRQARADTEANVTARHGRNGRPGTEATPA